MCDRRCRGEPDRLADLTHSGRVADPRHPLPDHLEDPSLARCETVVASAVVEVRANMDRRGAARAGGLRSGTGYLRLVARLFSQRSSSGEVTRPPSDPHGVTTLTLTTAR